ncbi:hypothetical protein N9M12_00460 [Gammaproteobacteria bacterium]|nr:hypothetical protein [Gammaproteobacteria bacterium]
MKSPLILLVGSFTSSLINFFIYVVLPRFGFVDDAEKFFSDFIVGGFFLFSFGSSVASIAIYSLNSANPIKTIKDFAILYFFASFIFITFGIIYDPFSLYGVFSAIFLGVTGFFQSILIGSKKLLQASMLAIVPAFGFLLGIYIFQIWILGFLFSGVLSVTIAILLTKNELIKIYNKRNQFNYTAKNKSYDMSIIQRTIASVLLPLFLQFEVYLAITLLSDPTLFISSQKLYASVAISASGLISTHFAALTKFNIKYQLVGALFISFLSLILMIVLNIYLSIKFELIELYLIFLLSFLFGFISIGSTKMIVEKPSFFISAAVSSFLLYSIILIYFIFVFQNYPLIFSMLFYSVFLLIFTVLNKFILKFK